MPRPKRLIRHGGEPTSIFLADLRDRQVVGRIDHGRASELSAEIDLRDGAVHLDDELFELDSLRWSQRLAFNETMLAPKAFSLTNGVCEVTLGISTYARFRAAREQLLALSSEERVASMMRNRMATPLAFIHTLGVNCTLETADGKLLTTRRSSSNATGVGKLSVAMSEASNINDALGFEYDPLNTALRGLFEELGLRREDVLDFSVHSLIADAFDGGISLLGHARTRLTAEEVVARHATASDGHEAGELIFDELQLEAMSELLMREQWVPWGVPGMLGLVALRFGDAASAALEEQISYSAPALP